MATKVRRPVPNKQPEETYPGDVIELSVTEEVKTSGGSRWVKVGLSSQQRPDETSAEATERIENFVLTSLAEFIQAAIR